MKNPKPPHGMIEKKCCNQPKHHMNNQYPLSSGNNNCQKGLSWYKIGFLCSRNAYRQKRSEKNSEERYDLFSHSQIFGAGTEAVYGSE